MTSNEIVRQIAMHHRVTLPKESIQAMAGAVTCRKYKKGEIILNEGEVCKSIRYIEKGMLRQFYFKYGKELTEHIAYENGDVVCLESYLKQEPTRLMIEALEATVLWEVPKDEIEQLAFDDPNIGVMYRRFFEQSLIDSQIKADILRFEPAHERYERLLRRHPEILKRAPLIYIASFLQMTPETLSRVRSASNER